MGRERERGESITRRFDSYEDYLASTKKRRLKEEQTTHQEEEKQKLARFYSQREHKLDFVMGKKLVEP